MANFILIQQARSDTSATQLAYGKHHNQYILPKFVAYVVNA